MEKSWLLVGIMVCTIAVSTAQAEGPAELMEQKEDLEILERNVRLDFKVVPLEEGDKGITIITASPEYETGVRLKGEEGKIEFEVSGEVHLLDNGQIFVEYEAYTAIVTDEREAEFSVTGGVLLEAGEEIGVSRMGEKTLMIGASYVEPKGDSE